MPKADVKFFMNAKVSIRAKRRHKELLAQGYKITLKDILKTIKKRDISDYTRKISPLKKTKESILIETSNLTIKQCFYKMKKHIDQKLQKI